MSEKVNHPEHYNRPGGMECYDEMLLFDGLDALIGWARCSCRKYRYRAADKNGIEDLKKSDVMARLYLDLMDYKTWLGDHTQIEPTRYTVRQIQNREYLHGYV